MLKRYVPLRKRRTKPRAHKFTVRVRGKQMQQLRRTVYHRDQGRCSECDVRVYWQPRFPGDPLAYDLAHIRSRGAGGDDSPANTHVLCHRCHMKEHNGAL